MKSSKEPEPPKCLEKKKVRGRRSDGTEDKASRVAHQVRVNPERLMMAKKRK